MSTSAEQFQAPNVEVEDYYERLGAPSSASAEEIDNHTKKYVAKFKPELSDHENADERWDRFNEARRTLNDASEKELYDTFRGRFGPERGAEAYQAWEARNRPKDPARVDPVRDLGVAPNSADKDETGETTSSSSTRQTETSRQTRTETGSRTRQRTETRQDTTQRTSESERQTRQRTTRRDPDRDLDTTGTHSTRSTTRAEQTGTGTAATGSSFIDELFNRFRTKTDVVVAEIVTGLSMLGWVLLAYLTFILVGDIGAGAVISSISSVLPISGGVLQSGVHVLFVAVLGFVLLREYFDRFSGDEDRSGPFAPPGQEAIKALETPRRALIVPTVIGLLATLVFAIGGGGFITLVAGGALLSVHGRFRAITRIDSFIQQDNTVGPVAGVCALIAFVALFVQVGSETSLTEMTVLSYPITVVVVGLAYAMALLSPAGAIFAASRAE